MAANNKYLIKDITDTDTDAALPLARALLDVLSLWNFFFFE